MNYSIRLLFLIFILVSPLSRLAASGISESQKSYNDDIKQEFPELVRAVSEDGTAASVAKEHLRSIRNRYGIAYTDEAGVIDSLIDKAGEGAMTPDEAQFYFELLTEGKLTEYRKETQKRQSEIRLKEVITLLQQEIVRETEAEGLLNVLNNFYDFFGLDYGDEYHNLSNLIIAFRNGTVSSAGLQNELALITRKIEREEAARLRESAADGNMNNPQQASGGNSSHPSGSTSTQTGGGSSSGSSGNKPSSSGSGGKR